MSPTQIEEAYATAKWVAAHGNEIGVNGSRMAVAGNSVGGNMSAVIALMAKDRGGPKIRLQVLFYPVKPNPTATSTTDASWRVPS
jgi:acetyl esterase